MDKAVIENGVVVNVIVLNADVSEWDGKQVVPLPAGVGIGWLYENGEFVRPE
jgi:hypothetical protein